METLIKTEARPREESGFDVNFNAKSCDKQLISSCRDVMKSNLASKVNYALFEWQFSNEDELENIEHAERWLQLARQLTGYAD